MTLQYFKPPALDHWVGDCMPFYHAGLFHFYYLLDEGHHQALGGLGGHQWAHATTTDLKEWLHHPLALPISEAGEVSICTGSIFHYGDTYYAFHAVRQPDWTQRLGLATSADGIHFTKMPVPPHAEPPPAYDPHHFRDPVVFHDTMTNRFHMLVTSKLVNHDIPALGGCLAHLMSDDLQQWTMQEPFLLPGFTDAPECPDWFEWNGWYYLVFSNQLQARYRMARSPLGPWLRPQQDLLDGPWTRVMKTAPYHDDRRLGVAWVGTRQDDRDTGKFQWGGHAVFREIVQHPDGTLGTKFVPEMNPASHAPVSIPITAQTGEVTTTADGIDLTAGSGMAAVGFAGVPRNVQITMTLRPHADAPRFGVRLRESAHFVDGVTLDILAAAQRVELYDAPLDPVIGLDAPITLEIILKDDLIDVCLNGRYCLINRCPEQRGELLTLFCHTGSVRVEDLTIRPLVEKFSP